MFVLHREDESGLVLLTMKGSKILQAYPETCSSPCMRPAAEAKEVWFQTTRHVAPDLLPIDGYRNWQSVERQLKKRHPMGFTYDHKLQEAGLNNIWEGVQERSQKVLSKERCQCRYCNYLWGIDAVIRPDADTCFLPDAEFLEMEIRYASQKLEIFRLERDLEETMANKAFSDNRSFLPAALQTVELSPDESTRVASSDDEKQHRAE